MDPALCRHLHWGGPGGDGVGLGVGGLTGAGAGGAPKTALPEPSQSQFSGYTALGVGRFPHSLHQSLENLWHQ